jgi:hypothetical protein
MAYREFYFSTDLGAFTDVNAEEPDYWDEPEIIIDPISCMVVAVFPRSQQRVSEAAPPRPRRTHSGLSIWRAALARWLAPGKRPGVTGASPENR